MPQVRVRAVLAGLQTISTSYFTSTYGASSVGVHRRRPSSNTYKKLKELIASTSLQTLVFFWPEIVAGADPHAWVTTPGASLKEDWVIHAEVFRGHNDTDASYEAFLDFMEDFRAELADSDNIRAGQTPGIRVGPWLWAELGTSNKGTFCNYGHLSAYFQNQPRST